MNDLISRQAAIDILAVGDALLSRALDDMDVVGVERDKFAWGLGLIDSYIEDFKELPSVNQWIPCFEKLPDENEMVLISAKYIGHLSQNAPYVEEGFFTHDGWYSAYGDDYSELLAKVVAWMPLPKPYKGESDEIQ